MKTLPLLAAPLLAAPFLAAPLLAGFALAVLVVAAPLRAHAATPGRSIAMLVGANAPAPGRTPLQFALRDAALMADTLARTGRFTKADIVTLLEPGPRQVLAELERVASSARESDGPGLFVFYYSGHSDGQHLFPGGEALAYRPARGHPAAARARARRDPGYLSGRQLDEYQGPERGASAASDRLARRRHGRHGAAVLELGCGKCA